MSTPYFGVKVRNHVQRKKIEEGKKKKLAELYLFRERICGFSRSVEFGSCYTWGGRTDCLRSRSLSLNVVALSSFSEKHN